MSEFPESTVYEVPAKPAMLPERLSDLHAEIMEEIEHPPTSPATSLYGFRWRPETNRAHLLQLTADHLGPTHTGPYPIYTDLSSGGRSYNDRIFYLQEALFTESGDEVLETTKADILTLLMLYHSEGARDEANQAGDAALLLESLRPSSSSLNRAARLRNYLLGYDLSRSYSGETEQSQIYSDGDQYAEAFLEVLRSSIGQTQNVEQQTKKEYAKEIFIHNVPKDMASLDRLRKELGQEPNTVTPGGEAVPEKEPVPALVSKLRDAMTRTTQLAQAIQWEVDQACMRDPRLTPVGLSKEISNSSIGNIGLLGSIRMEIQAAVRQGIHQTPEYQKSIVSAASAADAARRLLGVVQADTNACDEVLEVLLVGSHPDFLDLLTKNMNELDEHVKAVDEATARYRPEDESDQLLALDDTIKLYFGTGFRPWKPLVTRTSELVKTLGRSIWNESDPLGALAHNNFAAGDFEPLRQAVQNLAEGIIVAKVPGLRPARIS